MSRASRFDVAGRLRLGDEAVGTFLDRAFPAAANPWRHLGALAFLFFVVCLLSGIYAYALFDTSLAGAYDSARALSAGPGIGRLTRGLHRYSADAFLVASALHLAREAARGHFRAFRAWSWLSGVALVPILWIAGITGFWLAWDERALFSANALAEWLAAAPFRLDVFVRNFLAPEAMNDRFFSLAIFLHIGLPLALLAGCWIHFLRLSHVRAWPPAALTGGSLAALCALALALPVTSLAPAAALKAPATIAIDWFYLFPHALAEAITPEGLWGVALALALALTALPWLPGRAIASAARVDLANCNGCARCAADCPFGAVVMAPRSDARPHPREARVIPDLCAACGICAGACPSSTPFRRIEVLASGIDLPEFPIARLRSALDRALDREPNAVIVFSCARAGRPAMPDRPGVATIEAECAAMVPPAFIEYGLRSGAAGVVIAGCREGDCEYRTGDRWTLERLAQAREPGLRPTVPRDRVRVSWGGSDPQPVESAIEALSRVPESAARSPPARRA